MATRKPSPIPAEDKEWRARSDAEALARAHEIMSDKSRHAAAKAHAGKEAAKYAKVVGASPLRRARGK